MIRKIQIIAAALLSSASTIAAQHSPGVLSIAFVHQLNGEPLKLDTVSYVNSVGQSYTLTKFKYYISNIRLKDTAGKEFASKACFLIDDDIEQSKTINLVDVPKANYTSISFVVGIDSVRNCSGAQSGALDPANGMFWVWNTGYIFLKLEGKSASSTAPGKIVEYHIGGYKQPSNCIRTIELPFTSSLPIGNAAKAELKIAVHVEEILKNPTPIDFAKIPSVVDSKNATTIADNYVDMFSIQK